MSVWESDLEECSVWESVLEECECMGIRVTVDE